MSSQPQGALPSLSVVSHDRYVGGNAYVYPVISRRAGGVSVGINLNPNDSCNWRCVYCQVPGLKTGVGPDIDLDCLRAELRALLGEIVQGDFFTKYVPEGSRRLNDVAFSGNGEPTTSPQFARAVDLVGEVLSELGVLGQIKVVLISNGSMMRKPQVQQALRRMAALNGEVWLKIDRATLEGTRQVNSVGTTPERTLERLASAAACCPTCVQTCLFACDGQGPAESERLAYLELLAESQRRAIPLRGVLLYGLARPSHQPEGPRLSALPTAELQVWAEAIGALGIPVKLSE